MPINADKPHLWKPDINASVDQYNAWFMEAAPVAFRETRLKTTGDVLIALALTSDHRSIRFETLKAHPEVLNTLRMSTCPPIAVDRLIGLAGVSKNLVNTMTKKCKLPRRTLAPALEADLSKMADILNRLLDPDLFPWIPEKRGPSDEERARAASVVADRLCGALTNPIIRNAQERRQLALIAEYLNARGYKEKAPASGKPLTDMEPGTFGFRVNLPVGDEHKVKIPIDVVIQPKKPRADRFPILIEAKSAGDFTNPNKRRKEEAKKISQLRETYGPNTQLVLFLCGYFDGGYLGYEAAEGIDWIWEHRISDLDQLGI